MDEAGAGAPRGGDRCPYCLRYAGLTAARAEAVRFCPECGADWDTLAVESPPAPAGEGGRPPDDAPPAVAAPAAPGRDATADAVVLTPPPPPATARGPGAGPLLIGLLLGLAAAVTAAFVLDRLTGAAEPTAAAPPAPSPPPIAAPTAPVPRPAPPRPRAKPASPPPAAPRPAPPPLPSPPDDHGRRREAVEQAIALATAALPRAARVELAVRVEGGVAFLSGQVDSAVTGERVAAAAAEVFGIRAVDTRGLKVAWRHHRVQPGETLIGLAAHYYGEPAAWQRIWKANPEIGARPDAIVAGTNLLIPTE